jgi:hypothetical protein
MEALATLEAKIQERQLDFFAWAQKWLGKVAENVGSYLSFCHEVCLRYPTGAFICASPLYP